MIWNKKKDGAENPGAETPAAQTTKAPVLFCRRTGNGSCRWSVW